MGFFLRSILQLTLIGISVIIAGILMTNNEFIVANEYPVTIMNNKNQKLQYNSPLLKTPYPIDNIELSLVVPSYNEENRLPKMLKNTIKYFDSLKIIYEIILVNDGSKDKTWDIMLGLIKKYPNNSIYAINYGKNAGKGHAVMTGMKYTKGNYILMLDADGATETKDYEKLKKELDQIKTEYEDLGISIGSRAHLESADVVKVERNFFRKVLGVINNLFVEVLIGVKNIKDTQCGFKLFTRKAANKIVFNTHLTRWAFDVEMLYIANKLNIPVKEVSVNWREIEGSKLNIVTASLSFFRDYFAIIVFYSTGVWNLVVQ